MHDELRGTVNQLTYGIIFKGSVTDTDVASMVDAVLHQRGFGLPPEQYYRAALGGASDNELDETQRDFLARVVAEMDARRPWPDLPYVADLPTAIDDMTDARPIGTIWLSQYEIEDNLLRSFDPLPGRPGEVLVLRIDDHRVALQAKASRSAQGVTLLASGSAEEVLALFRERTDLPVDASE